MDVECLRSIGLSEGELKVYNAMTELGQSSMNKIQEKTGIDRRNIYDILNKLIEKGLISYTVEQGKKTFQMTHPEKILSYLDNKKEHLEQIKKEIAPKMPELIRAFKDTKQEIRAEVYRGKEAIKALHEESLNYEKIFWIGGNSQVQTNVDLDMKNWFNHWMKKRAEKKVLMYDLVDYGTFLVGLEPHKKQVHKKNYYKYCELPKDLSSPMVIFMFGNKVAQILWDKQPFAFVLESEKIKNSFMKYFKYFWKE